MMLALILLAQITILQPGLYCVPPCGSPSATASQTPVATPTPAVIIGPAPALPWLRQFYAGGGFLPVHASANPVAWTFLVDQSVGALDVTIDGTMQYGGNSSKHTWVFIPSSEAGYFSWAPPVGTHAFVLTFYDYNGVKMATVPETVPVVP